MLRGFWLGVSLLAAAGCSGGESFTEAPGAVVGMAGGSNEAGAPSEPRPVICDAGRTVECPCVNSGKGVQACAGDGSKWEECQCADVTPPPPEKKPAEACGMPWDITLVGEQACPVGMPAVYQANACLAPYVASGVCALNRDENFVCCPAA